MKRASVKIIDGIIESCIKGALCHQTHKKDPCVYCGDEATTKDHITPRSAGGKGHGNFAPACAKCNTAKGRMSLLVFLVRRHNFEMRPDV